MQVFVYCFRTENGKSRSILVPLRGLNKLAVNDKLRSEIYFEDGLKESLKIILMKGNEIEQKYAIKVLCQLSFNHDIALDIVKDEDLVLFLKRIGGIFNFSAVLYSCYLFSIKQRWQTH